MSYLGKHAEHYDLFYRDKPYREEAQYTSGLIRLRKAEALTVLDLGCGTGVRCLELARLGYRVCGLDQSADMLAMARQHCLRASDFSQAAIRFLEGDITAFVAEEGFDAVISLFHVFSYLTTPKALGDALSCCFHNLNPGGVLIFDYWHGPAVTQDPPAIRRKTAEDSAVRIERTSVPTLLSDNDLVELSVSLQIEEKKTRILQKVEERYVLRYWFPEELERQLAKIGFSAVCHYSWMTLSAPTNKDWQVCTVATKATR
jgi:SAM-dependent methyltransferase